MTNKLIARKLKAVLHELNEHNKHISMQFKKRYLEQYDQNLWSTCLYIRFINCFQDIHTLLNSSNNVAGVLVLIRSCFDCWINLKNVVSDDGYKMYRQSEKDKLKNSPKLLNPKDLQTKQDQEKLLSYLINLEKSWQELKNVEPKFIKETKKLGRVTINFGNNSFELLYRTLSEHVHAGHAALVECQMKRTTQNEYQASRQDCSREIILYAHLYFLMILAQDITIKVTTPLHSDNLKNIHNSIEKARNFLSPYLQDHNLLK